MENLSRTQTVPGLGTVLTLVAPNTDTYTIDGKITAPLSSTVPSAVIVTINKNGSPAYTGTAGAQGFQCSIQCTAGDTITVVLTSSSTTDIGLNVVKTTIAVSEGI